MSRIAPAFRPPPLSGMLPCDQARQLVIREVAALRKTTAAETRRLREALGFVLAENEAESLAQPARFGEIGRAHSELQSRLHLVCRLLLEKKKKRANVGR